MKCDHILLTTDLSDASTRAFEAAADLAEKFDAKITVLHVVNVHLVRAPGAPLAPPMTLPIDEEAVDAAKRDLPEFAARHLPSGGFDTKVVAASNVSECICDQAEELGADLIAMSTHGRSGLSRFFLGSVAELVLRHATIPVLCFPPPEQPEE